MGLKLNNAGDKPVISLYGVIGDDYGGVTADHFRKMLSDIDSKKPIELRIHSEGGSYFDGVAIHSQLKSRKGAVSVVIDGLAASAASLVAMAGKSIEMAKHSWMMIHEARLLSYGTAEDFRKSADMLDEVNQQITDIYTARWKGTAEDLRAAVAAETWMTADEAIGFGLADTVAESLAIAARFDPTKFHYQNVPEAVLEPKPDPHADRMADILPLYVELDAK